MATITNTQTAALDFLANILDSIGIPSDSLGPVQLGPVQRRISTQLRKGPKIYWELTWEAADLVDHVTFDGETCQEKSDSKIGLAYEMLGFCDTT